ncbi:MAG: CoA transferase [Chloroflexi bacterium]|nr:CoA transferase [Chloroflexota bacterium]
MSEQALSHLKVLELCNFVCGPYCTKLLADLGAEVIKIEPPGIGDDSRRRGPFLKDIPHPERSGLYLYLNTNKLGITLDIKTSTGRGIFRELIRQADIFVEDNPPKIMKEMGLTYQELKKINPSLVMTSVTPFGQTGPYRDYKAHELNLHHAGGEGYLLPTQSPDLTREPVKAGGLVGDCICGLSSAIATLAGAYNLNETGVGQHINVSKQDVLMTMVLLEIAMYANMGIVRNRLERPLLMPIPMECQDGYIMISALTDREWQDLVKFMGNPSWAKEERFSQWLQRHLHGDEINPHIREFVKHYKKEELFQQLQENALAAAPVNTAEDLVKSAQMESRGFFAEVEHPEAGKLKHPTVPYKFSKTPWKAERTAPSLGQHNKFVYCERLGYSKEEVTKLKETGVI